ncbi:MAG: DUF1186 domain-containing protein [Candidatus Electrothrix gigas]
MDVTTYTEPVSALLTYGSARNIKDWSVYLELGLTKEHIPELIKMVGDEDLNQADGDSNEVWAPIHAWRTLGVLRAIEAIPALIDQLYQVDEYHNDWITKEMPHVFATIGEPAIKGLIQYAGNTSRTLYARSTAASSLRYIGKKHPETREACIAGLEKALAGYRQNDYYLNSSFVACLISLKAVEAFPTIQKAYQDDCVDWMACGDLEDVERALGLKEKQVPERSQTFSGYRREGKKIGRNEPCPCGSRKKYKKCCLNK